MPFDLRQLLTGMGGGGRPGQMDYRYGDEYGQMLDQLRNGGFAQRVLSPYGLSVPDRMNENLLFPEPGTDNFFGRHPRVSRAIENALLNASLTKSGDTIGENISNVAGAILGAPQVRRDIQMQRFMAPFAMAEKLAGLEKTQVETETARKHGEYWANYGKWQKQQAKYLPGSLVLDKRTGKRYGINTETWQNEEIPGASLGPQPDDPENQTENEALLSGEAYAQAQESRKRLGLPLFESYDEYYKEAMKVIGAKAASQQGGRNNANFSDPNIIPPAEADARRVERDLVQKEYDQLGDLKGVIGWMAVNPGKTMDDARARREQLGQELRSTTSAPSRRTRSSAAPPPANPGGLKALVQEARMAELAEQASRGNKFTDGTTTPVPEEPSPIGDALKSTLISGMTMDSKGYDSALRDLKRELKYKSRELKKNRLGRGLLGLFGE
jgi:hypothetical protein